MDEKFYVLANQFSFDRSGDTPGRAIASADAIYLIPGTYLLDLNTGPRVEATLMSAMGSADVKRLAAKFTERFENELTDLESLLAEEDDWPIRKEVAGIILPRAEISRMKYPWWGALNFLSGEKKVVIKPIFVRRKRVLNYLRQAGWEI